MRRPNLPRLALVVGAALIGFADHSAAQQTVESCGISAKVKLQDVVSGHLQELNGKF